MAKLVFNVSAKDMTISECIKLTVGVSYEDAIYKDMDYVNVTQKNISISNSCNKTFTTNGIDLFSETMNGSNFMASINAFTIAPFQTISVPVFYNGMFKLDVSSKVYPIVINGISSTYKLTLLEEELNTPPDVTDVVFKLNNRAVKIFSITDFENHFTDLDNDSLEAVILIGNVDGFKVNGLPYVENTEISRSDIISGLFTYESPNVDAVTEKVVVWKGKDSAGNISI